MRKRYVVIGSGIAGITAAETIRSLDREGEIIVLSKEKELPYSRPMLSKSPLLSMGLKSFALHDEEWYREQHIDLRLGTSVDKLNVDDQNILVGDESISYDKCIIATGAMNFVPPFKGRDDVEICDIRKLSDLKHLRRLAFPGGKAVVIGGGVIGLEMAAEIRRYGMEVTVLEAMDRLMPRLIDEKTSEKLVERLPFEVFTGINITRLSKDGEKTVIEDDKGRSWDADLLIVSCGVRADVSLARDAGISVNRAIILNDKIETSAKNVYACGDCAEFKGFNAALWSEGLAQGEVAGRNAAGEET
ncbi:MAG: NAD(P)/FAD-dependent oxidoreductase, partial [Firmicutes bacterium]|nr:NAD(P)/FAD-dependent oxidoreductase [Bacillota bacterium]